MIGITGATGHLGQLTVQALLGRGVPAAEMVRVILSRARKHELS